MLLYKYSICKFCLINKDTSKLKSGSRKIRNENKADDIENLNLRTWKHDHEYFLFSYIW